MSDRADPRERNVVAVLEERGLIAQMTESGLPEAAADRQLYVYCGFDPTAPSLHVGNLVPVMVLAHFQRHSHRPILVVGGGTGMIGDPSGKSVERPLLSSEQVAEHVERIRDQLAGYLTFEGPAAATMVNNADWLGKMTLIEYLRDIGKHFSVNTMLAKESVKTRMSSEQGISYTEFSYMILQATDFLHLFDAYGCTVQVGGTDQWGNLLAGVELIRRTREARVHALTVPLITTATGAKFGKSEGNALWLDPAMTTPYEMYQYWINTDDRDVGHFLKIFTFLPLDEIAALEREQAAHPERREAQRVLAFAVTKLIHGEATALQVAKASLLMFGGVKEASSTIAATDQVLATMNQTSSAAIAAREQALTTIEQTIASIADSAASVATANAFKVIAIVDDAFSSLAEAQASFDEVVRAVSDSHTQQAGMLASAMLPTETLSQPLEQIYAVGDLAKEDLAKARKLLERAPTRQEWEQARKLLERAPTRQEWEQARKLLERAPARDLEQMMLMYLANPATPALKLDLGTGMPIADALVKLGLQPSKGAARRLINQGGLRVNDTRWTNPDAELTSREVKEGGYILLRIGKSKKYVVQTGAPLVSADYES